MDCVSAFYLFTLNIYLGPKHCTNCMITFNLQKCDISPAGDLFHITAF